MRLGENEKVVLTILKHYSEINQRQLNILFSIIAKKKGRVDNILRSLRVKGLVESDSLSIDLDQTKNLNLAPLDFDNEFIMDIKSLEEVKLGKLGKLLLYVIGKTEKSSLQFLSNFFQKPSKNIYAILQRLEERNFVLSFNSRIRRLNSAGRKFHPKYYVLTDKGKIWIQANESRIRDKEKIDELLRAPEEKIAEFNLKV